mmetsp:Transcript_61214/g.162718  ORF Transcript_61214/g.162718 Transcript_61214/m.162718 type:complete len:266 (-) Transcript_61214:7-804(-)
MSMSSDLALPFKRKHALKNSSNCTSPLSSTSSSANTYLASSALTLIFFHSFAISGSSSFSSRSLVVMHPQLSSALHLWKRAMIWSVRKFSSSRSALWSAVWTKTPVTTFISASMAKAMKAANATPSRGSTSLMSGSATSPQSTPPESACHSDRIVWPREWKCSLSLSSPVLGMKSLPFARKWSVTDWRNHTPTMYIISRSRSTVQKSDRKDPMMELTMVRSSPMRCSTRTSRKMRTILKTLSTRSIRRLSASFPSLLGLKNSMAS